MEQNISRILKNKRKLCIEPCASNDWAEQICNNIRQEAHALVYMAVADAANHNNRQAAVRFKKARAMYAQTGEITEEIDSLMKKYGLQ